LFFEITGTESIALLSGLSGLIETTPLRVNMKKSFLAGCSKIDGEIGRWGIERKRLFTPPP